MKKPTVLKLANGITCILDLFPRAKSFSFGILVGAGSSTETEETIGFSHFVEHMIFKGTQKRTYKEINKEIEKYGGYINAFTDRNYTLFYTKIIPQFYEKGLEILTDIVFNSVFPEEEIKKEIKVVLEEISMYEDSPDDNIVDLLFEISYPDSYLGWPILGKRERISSIKRSEVVDYWEKLYYPENIIISAAGNFDLKNFLKIVENIKPNGNKIKKISNKTPKFYPNKQFKTKEVEQKHIGIGKETINIYSQDEEKYSLLLLNNIIGANSSSRLYSKIREDMGLCYSISSSVYLDRETGLFSVFTATDPRTKNMENIIIEEIENIRINKIKDEEIEISKAQMKSSIMFNQENISSIMKRNASQFFWYKKLISPQDILKKIEKIKIENIQEIYEKTFYDKNYSIYHILPKYKKGVIKWKIKI